MKRRHYKIEPLHYHDIELFDFASLWEQMRSIELDKIKKAGKAWTRGESLDGLDPELRYRIEKTNNPNMVYPVAISTV